MTAQINDSVFFRGRVRSIAAVDGSGLFDPAQQALRVCMFSTACSRGYYCQYEISDGALFLNRVHLGLLPKDEELARIGEGPRLFGSLPVEDAHRGAFVYEGLRQPVDFSGGLLLAADFIRELYIHMGFHPAWKYESVFELKFGHGKLIDEWDRSKEMALIRAKISEHRRDREALGAWIASCCSFDYPSVREINSSLMVVSASPAPREAEAPKLLRLTDPLPCPHCGSASTSYRELSNGWLLCLECSRSLPPLRS